MNIILCALLDNQEEDACAQKRLTHHDKFSTKGGTKVIMQDFTGIERFFERQCSKTDHYAHTLIYTHAE